MEIWKDLEIFRKTTKVYGLNFKKDGLPLDITDWTIYFTMKENMGDIDDDAKIKKDIITHLDATNGKTTIELSTTDTNLTSMPYYYDIKYKDDEDNVGILYRGRITIVEPVTTRE